MTGTDPTLLHTEEPIGTINLTTMKSLPIFVMRRVRRKIAQNLASPTCARSDDERDFYKTNSYYCAMLRGAAQPQ
ncbi:hypothetical protein BST61_g9861 [Cercospora zeina]